MHEFIDELYDTVEDFKREYKEWLDCEIRFNEYQNFLGELYEPTTND